MKTLLLLTLLSGCASVPVMSPQKPPTLSWEGAAGEHPERKEWSTALVGYLNEKFDSFDKAKDSSFFCPKFSSLTHDQKVNVWAETLVWVAYYESGWNPKSASVDVGTQDNKDSWSIGLLQMSVTDQANYGFPFGYSYNDLLLPAPNLRLGVAIMAKQIERRGAIVLTKPDSAIYWSTIFKGGRYDSSQSIAGHVKKLTFCN